MTVRVKQGESREGVLVVVFCCLMVIIVGLVVGIVAVSNNSNRISEETDVENDDPGLQALIVQEEIDDRYDNDSSYTLQDAIDDYEREMNEGSSAKRIYVAINYADFVYTQYEDIDKAMAILKRVEPLLTDEDAPVTDYYVAVKVLYEKAGEDEQAEKYDQMIMEMTPEITPEEQTTTDNMGDDGL